VKDLQEPDRILVGGKSQPALQELVSIYECWVEKDKIITTSLWTAELAKLAAHAFLAQRMTSINSIASLCEVTGADIEEVRGAIGADQRIGANFLEPNLGFGRGTFTKALQALIYLAEYHGMEHVANYWRTVVQVNDWSQRRVYDLICRALFGTLKEKTIAIIGFSETGVDELMHQTSEFALCCDLMHDGASLRFYAPGLSVTSLENTFQKHSTCYEPERDKISGMLSVVDSLQAACDSAHAVIILTRASSDQPLSLEILRNHTHPLCWLFDARRGLEPVNERGCNLDTWQIGNGAV
jgi:UDPglucose 6-dehydrogenase